MKKKIIAALLLIAILSTMLSCQSDPLDEIASEDAYFDNAYHLDGTDWDFVTNAGTSTDNAVTRFDGATGRVVQDSGVLVDDSDNMTLPGDFDINGDQYTDRYLNSNTNTLLGFDAAGAGNMTHGGGAQGWYNTFIGSESGYSITSGLCNTGVGRDALYSVTNGVFNTALGQLAGYSISTGDYNSALGRAALYGNTGSNNTAIGCNTMYAGSGSYNVAIGRDSMYSGITGGYNVGIGNSTLYNAGNASFNFALGATALLGITTGDGNMAMGDNALRSSQTGQNNVGIGRQAGYSVLGSRNIMLGYQAGYSETGSDKLYIDPSNTASPLIYGDFSSEYIDINGWLGIVDNYLELDEMTAPGAGSADTVRIYADEGGDGLTDLNAVFQDGTIVTFAEETTPLDSPIFTKESGTEMTYQMIKPHPGLVQFVAVFPSGEGFVMREIEYHLDTKIAANTGCESSVLPAGWEVHSERDLLTDEINSLLAKKAEYTSSLDMVNGYIVDCKDKLKGDLDEEGRLIAEDLLGTYEMIRDNLIDKLAAVDAELNGLLVKADK